MRLSSRLEHTRLVHSIHWRRPRPHADSALVLVVISEACVAHLYAPVLDEPGALRQWAAIDAASDMRDILSESDAPEARHIVSLMYCDAYHVAVALQHDMAQIEQQQLLSAVSSGSASKPHAARLHQLAQYLEHAPDLFFALMGDGAMMVCAAMHIDHATPHLLHTYTCLRIPPCISNDLSSSALVLAFAPLAPASVRLGTLEPTALVHAQTPSGLRGTIAVSLALLLDGDPRGLLVQDAMVSSQVEAPDAPADDGPQLRSLLRAEHRSDIIQLQATDNRRRLLSLSRDGVLIWWKLHHAQRTATFVSRHRMRLRDVYMATSLGEHPHVAALSKEALLIALVDGAAFAPSDTTPSTLMHQASVQLHSLPHGVEPSTVLCLVCVPCDDAYRLLIVTRSAHVHTWSVRHCDGWSVSETGTHTLRHSGAADALACASLTTHGSLLTVSADGALDVWHIDAWTPAQSVATGLADVHAAKCSADQCVAVVSRRAGEWHVRIIDLTLVDFGSPFVHEMHLGTLMHEPPTVAWTHVRHLGCILAVGADARVRLVAEGRPRAWTDLALGGVDTGYISHVLWIMGERLLVSSSCQLFLFHDELFDSEPTEDGAMARAVPMSEIFARHRALRPWFDPDHLLVCLHMGCIDAVAACIDALTRVLRGGSTMWDALDTSVFATRDAELQLQIPAESLAAVREQAGKALPGAVGLAGSALDYLARVLTAIREVSAATHVGTPARQLLAGLFASALNDEFPPFMVWGFLSADQEMLVSKVQGLINQQIGWPTLRATGVFGWARQRALLLPLMEQVARAEFTRGDDTDPVQSSLFYLALRNVNMVRSIWRRAVGHPDQGKMVAFLSKDFTEERWRLAAQKNAFALLSQRRFNFAAAFFLLGGALKDAATVCVRNLGDLSLALAIARVYEDDDVGPVFRDLLRRQVVPRAVATGDRWLGCWALLVLKEHALMLRMLRDPLASFARDAKVRELCGDMSASEDALDLHDPCLLLLLEHAKGCSWYRNTDVISPIDEVRFVCHCARLFGQDGTCTWDALLTQAAILSVLLCYGTGALCAR